MTGFCCCSLVLGITGVACTNRRKSGTSWRLELPSVIAAIRLAYVLVTVQKPLDLLKLFSESINFGLSVALRGANARAGSKGFGLLCPTLGPDLALFVPGEDRTGPRVGQTGRLARLAKISAAR